jgi:hypothetical protein
MNEKTMLIILAVILVAIVLYYNYGAGSSKETFLAAGGMDHLGTIEPNPVRTDNPQGSYEFIEEPFHAVEPTLLSHKAADFANLIDDGVYSQHLPDVAPSNPMERLDELSDSYFPKIASKALPFSQEAAKPMYHTHAVNLPRVSLKGKLYEMNIAEAVRGSVPINYDPNVNVIGTSRYKNEDSFNPGYMTTAFNSLHSKLTGGYKNMPLHFAGAGQGSSGGNGVEAIYDF